MNGHSADKLRLLLHPYEEKIGNPETPETNYDDGDYDDDYRGSDGALIKRRQDTGVTDEENAEINTSGDKRFDFRKNVVLTTLRDSTRGEWNTAQVMYSHPGTHKVLFLLNFIQLLLEAILKDEYLIQCILQVLL